MRVFFCVILLGACASTESPTAVAPVEKPAMERPEGAPPAQEHAEQALEACVAECEQANAMRAVAPEVITADCQASCGAEPSPLGTQSLE